MQVFISYSWDSEEHKTWVRHLADRLQRSGIPVILDQYDLRGGSDIHQFMENAVSSSTHILVVCTPEYVSRANQRIKGAGEETSLVTSDFYNRHMSGKKYLPLVRINGEKSVPDYLGSLVYFDLTNDQTFEATFEELLRDIYEEPRFVKPALGKKPEFVSTQASPSNNPLSLENLKDRVLSSNSDDWAYDDEIGVYSNKNDIRLQIRNRRTDRPESFREEWTDRFPDPSATRDFYDVFYDNNKVCDYFQVSVDGGRVSIPIPQLGTNITISSEQYTFGKLIHYAGHCLYEYDSYLRRAGITVSQ